ncbi:MAG: efflux RND transporter periplasmic adaptor subunit [Prevotellaceae bacterium]|jgi:HlyD family secretion protein|nr:efflux RND transporter periplasmic adaptor subunit [Prevotellaceae bacterium]
MKKKTIIIIIVAIVALAVLAIILFSSGSGDWKVNSTQVETKEVEITVTATGYVQPVDKVDIGTQVSGVIEKIYVDFNSQVKKGELLAELDKSTLIEKVSQAQASLSSAQSDLTYSQQNYDRVKMMYDAKAATQASYEDAVNKLEQAKTSLTNSKANLHQAQVNLSYAEIYSPIDGVVLNRAVEQGQTVASSFNTPTLFTIANDLTKMQVEADVDEADIGQVKLGQKVSFTVDAYPDLIFEGKVNQIRMQALVTSNVVTYTVIVEAPNPDEKLFPGMTASITIVTQSEKGLAVPTEALSFNPTEETLKGLQIDSEEISQSVENAVWVKNGNKITEKEVQVGLNDGIYTIIKDGLKAGETVMLSVAKADNVAAADDAPAKNPLMPQRQRRRR